MGLYRERTEFVTESVPDIIALPLHQFEIVPQDGDAWLESMEAIMPRTSLLNLGVQLSPHPASDILRELPFCPCGCNRDRIGV